MNWRSWLRMNWRYWRGDTPWDGNLSPPELDAFLQTHSPGRAIDIGCGTGRNALRMAQAGWQVVGVDFALPALWQARRRARRTGLTLRCLFDDAAHLWRVRGRFDLALDIGCFHALGAGKANYLQRLDALLVVGGYWLAYGFRLPGGPGGIGFHSDDLKALPTGWQVCWQQPGKDAHGRPSLWILVRKDA